MYKAGMILCFPLLFAAAVALASSPVKIIVFPLNGSASGGDFAWLNEGIAISLSMQLGSSRVQVVDRDRRIEITKSLDLPVNTQLSQGSLIRVAQLAAADLAVIGVYGGTEQNLRISARVLDMKALKLGGEMSANGPLTALPQMENELAWLILTNTGTEKSLPRKKYQERMRKIPNAAFALYIQSLSEPGENERIRLLLKAVEIFRDFPEAHFRLGELYFHRGDCASAISHLGLGSCESTINPACQYMRGTCYLKGDQFGEAIRDFSQALTLTHSYEILNNMGVAYLRKGDNTQALSVLAEAASLAHGDPSVLLNLTLARYVTGDNTGARSLLQDAAKNNPNNGMLQFALGFLLEEQGEHDESAAVLRKAGSLGINVEKLLKEDPKKWAHILSDWPPQARNPQSQNGD